MTQNLYIMVVCPVVLKVWFGKIHWLATRVSSRFLWARSLSVRDSVLYGISLIVIIIKIILVLDPLLSI